MSPGQTTTEAYLRRIRRRALALVGVRATGAGVASALACVALAALVVGPLPVPAVAGAVLVVSGRPAPEQASGLGLVAFDASGAERWRRFVACARVSARRSA